MTKLKAPLNCGGFGHAGAGRYDPDADGFIEVPNDIVHHAIGHGFVVAEPEAPAETTEEKPVEKKGKKTKADSAA